MHFRLLQLWLFPELALADGPPMQGDDRDSRTGLQWLRSIIAYCEWRAGDCWRNVAFAAHRDNPHRWDYLAAVRLLNTLHYKTTGPELMLRSEMPAPVDVATKALALRPRAVLVSELLTADPSLTDGRLLSHLPRLKLAGMLVRARSDARRLA